MNGIDIYLSELDLLLSADKKSRTAILEEVRDHLLESTERGTDSETSYLEAELEAVTAFGSPHIVARHFNAALGAKAMRRAPKIAFTAGAMVVASFLFAAINQPKGATQATLASQVTFFSAVIAFQFALVAGGCAASRALATWQVSAISGASRSFVRRCTLVSMTALLAGASTMTVNFFFDAQHSKGANGISLAVGALLMVIAAGFGLFGVWRLKVNALDDDPDANAFRTRGLYVFGESAVGCVRRYPASACTIVAIAATAWIMSHAETATLVGSLPWGSAEFASVVAGFLILGPTLGLRSTS